MHVLLQHETLDGASVELIAKHCKLYRSIGRVPENGIDVLVVHPSLAGWPRAVHRLRRDYQRATVIAWVDDIAQAAVAVNELHARVLVSSTSELIEQLSRLGPVAPTESQEFEIRVQERTAVLQQIKAQWEQSFDAVVDPMAVMDGNCRIIRANRAYAARLSIPIVDVPGRKCHELQRRCAAGLIQRSDQQGCKGCPVLPGKTPRSASLEDKRGHRWAVSSYPIEVSGEALSFVVHYRDITRQVEELDRIARSNKMAAVGGLAGAIAHQLNSPMTSIMVFSEALSRKTDPESELHENAKEINESAQRCRRLIQGLLRFARRPRTAQMEAVSLPRVVSEMQPLVQHRIDVAQVKLELDIPFDLPAIGGRHADVEHLLVDLIVNALEACGPGDTITVRASRKAPQLVDLIVEDSGRGMSDDVLAAAFTPFFSTKEKDQGAGLGLTTCEAIVSEMGGTIALESRLGEGTRATLSLPIWGNHA